MKFFSKSSDGGKNSGVTGYYLVEIKPWFSIVLLKFNPGTREAYHEHAFNAWTWWIKGRVIERRLWFRFGAEGKNAFFVNTAFKTGSWKYTARGNCHRVKALETSWALSFRGPWVDTWREWRGDHFVTLTHGRKEISP